MEIEQRTIETLLEAYQDVSVCRGRIGDIIVWQNLPDGDQRFISVFLSRESEGQLYPDVSISACRIPADRKEREKLPVYTYVTVKPEGEQDTVVEVRNKQPDVKPQEMIAKAKQGLEIFDRLINTPPEERFKIPNNRAYDYMHGDLDADLKELGVDTKPELRRKLRETGLTSEDTAPEPHEQYRYMLKVLRRNMGEIREVE